jgi:hypothetical protein
MGDATWVVNGSGLMTDQWTGESLIGGEWLIDGAHHWRPLIECRSGGGHAPYVRQHKRIVHCKAPPAKSRSYEGTMGSEVRSGVGSEVGAGVGSEVGSEVGSGAGCRAGSRLTG